MLSQKFISECFYYDSETGDLTFKERPREHFKSNHSHIVANAKAKGAKVRSIHPNGNGNKYYKVKMSGKSHLAHRLVWVLIHGFEPEFIDHINGNGLDNRISNLRNVSRTENARNTKKYSTNTTGETGVYENKKYGGFCSMIWDKNKQINIGSYNTKEEAVAARKGAEKALGYYHDHGKRQSEIKTGVESK